MPNLHETPPLPGVSSRRPAPDGDGHRGVGCYGAAVLGALALFAIWAVVLVFARALLHQASETRWSVTGALAAGLMIAGPVFLTPPLGSLVASTAWVGGLAGAGLLLLWSRGPAAAAAALPAGRTPRAFTAATLLLFALAVYATIRGYWWDEHQCHYAVTAAVARGLVPVEFPLFPGELFRYHYGFNILAGQVRAFTGADVATGIDAATIGCLVLLLLATRDVGRALAGPVGGGLAMLLTPLGSGPLQVLLFRDMGALELRVSWLPEAWAQSVPPPVISNFFQHPQGLGMPLALAVLLLFCTEVPRALRPWRLVLGAFLLGVLALSQIVFFAVCGLALGVAALYRAARHRDPRGLAAELIALLAALGLGKLLGGFFAPGPEVGEVLKLGKSFFGGSVASQLARHLVFFGLPLLALPIALLRLRREATPLRVALATAAVVGFAIPSVMTYERSWDIVKFFGVGNFFANLLFAGLLTLLYARGQRALATAVLVISVASNIFFLLRMSVLDGRLGVPPMHFPPPPEIGRVVGDRLGPLVGLRGYVFSTNVDVARGGGLLTPGFDWRTTGQGFLLDQSKADRLLHHTEMARRDLDREDLEALGVSFLVLSPGDIGALTSRGRTALADPTRFEHLFDVEAGHERREIYRVLR